MQRMEFDLDAFVETEKSEWDFAVKFGGKRFLTRPLGVDDMKAMGSILADGLNAKDRASAEKALDALRAFVLSFFPGDRPDLSGLPLASLYVIPMNAARYFCARQRERTKSIGGIP